MKRDTDSGELEISSSTNLRASTTCADSVWISMRSATGKVHEG